MLEADLLRVYGVDLLDLYRGEISLRRVNVLMQGLPSDSLSIRRAAGISAELDAWSQESILLGRLIEAWTEEEVVPRGGGDTSTPETAKQVPLVSLDEAMGFVDLPNDKFAEKYLPPPD